MSQDKPKAFLYDGNKVLAWILEQKDLWCSERSAFHIGNLSQRYIEHFDCSGYVSSNAMTHFENYQIERIIAFEAHLANHVMMERLHEQTV